MRMPAFFLARKAFAKAKNRIEKAKSRLWLVILPGFFGCCRKAAFQNGSEYFQKCPEPLFLLEKDAQSTGYAAFLPPAGLARKRSGDSHSYGLRNGWHNRGTCTKIIEL